MSYVLVVMFTQYYFYKTADISEFKSKKACEIALAEVTRLDQENALLIISNEPKCIEVKP